MKRLLNALYDAKIWVLTLVSLMLFYIFLAWLAYPETFNEVLFLMVGVTLVVGALPFVFQQRKEAQAKKALHQFLNEPDVENEEELCLLLPRAQEFAIREMGKHLREKENRLIEQDLHVDEYETYIEEWVHEIKKPLSLLTLVLDNRTDEMSAKVEQRMSHVRSEIQNDVEKILFFSRLRTVHRDYVFERLDLRTLCQAAVEENHSILEESAFSVTYKGDTQEVISDQKSLLFILNQIIHNSTKYAKNGGELLFEMEADEQVTLRIKDNGPGISAGDLPFLFDKGFTGGKAKATGMGLYLTKLIADDLNIELSASGEIGAGLCISLTFPKVNGVISSL